MINKTKTNFDRQKKVIDLYDEVDKIVSEYKEKLEEMAQSIFELSEDPQTKDSSFIDLLDKMLGERVQVEEKVLSAKLELLNNIRKEDLIRIIKESDGVDK